MLHRCVSTFREFTAAISYWCHEKIFKSSQISLISWNHKFTIFTTARLLCQINPVHLFPSHFFRSVLILPSQPRLGLLSCHSSRLSNKNPVRIILILPCIQHSLPIWVSFLGSLISAEELNVGVCSIMLIILGVIKTSELYCETPCSGTSLYFLTLYSKRNHIRALFLNIFKEHETFISFLTLNLLRLLWKQCYRMWSVC